MAKAMSPVKVGEHKGKDVCEISLESSVGVNISFLNYGALIRDWQVPTLNGQKRSVVLGFDTFDPYPTHSPNFGAIVGRVANRIGGASFRMNGREYKLSKNQPPNHLHGGVDGFAKQVWDLNVLEEEGGGQAIQFTYTSVDGEMGYPGNLTCTATYRLHDYSLRLLLEAQTDAPTPVNLTQHNYFNLEGGGKVVADHWLQVQASKTLQLGKGNVPTGELTDVGGTPLDFNQPKQLKDSEGRPLEIDNSLVLDGSTAILESPDRQLRLKMWTDQPTIHVYTSAFLDVPVAGLNQTRYPKFGAICLEDQKHVDAPNHPNFPSIILEPGQTYKHECRIEIAPVRE